MVHVNNVTVQPLIVEATCFFLNYIHFLMDFTIENSAAVDVL